MPYYRGQGKVLVGKRNSTTGAALALRYIGKTSEVNVGLQAQTQTRKESETGQRLTSLRYATDNSASLEFKIEDATKENWGFAFRGTPAQIAAGTVTGEVLPTGLVSQDIVRTAKPDISSVVVTDSTGSPKTLPAVTGWSYFNQRAGSIQLLDITTGGPYVQPFKLAYSNALADNVPFFVLPDTEWWFRFEGLNDVDSGRPVLVELYKCYFDPAQTFPLKGDAPATFDIKGAPVYDDTKAADAVLGQFGRVVLLA
jgi:hypothetical protein